MVELLEFIELVGVHELLGHAQVIEVSGKAEVKASHWESSCQLTKLPECNQMKPLG